MAGRPVGREVGEHVGVHDVQLAVVHPNHGNFGVDTITPESYTIASGRNMLPQNPN